MKVDMSNYQGNYRKYYEESLLKKERYLKVEV